MKIEPVTRAFDDNGKIIVERIQDVEPVLELNKRLRLKDDGYSPTREMRRAASVPMVVIEKWLNEGFDMFDPNNAAELKRRLNSNEWAHLRTADGVL